MPVFDRPLASLPGVVDSDLAEPAGTLAGARRAHGASLRIGIVNRTGQSQ